MPVAQSSAAERQEFEAHLADGCEACRAELAAYGDLVANLLQALVPQAPPAAVWQRLRVRIAADELDRQASAEGPLASTAAAAPVSDGLLVVKDGGAPWSRTEYPGVELRVLYVDKQRQQSTVLVRMAPGSVYPAHAHHGAEECLVLEGDLRFGSQVLKRGDFLRTGPGYEQTTQTTEEGCLLYLTTPFE